MNLTLKVKIGRLPRALREEVNVRLRDGMKGREVVEWLNGLPEVQALLASEFGGKPVREQNVSEWRRNGHQQWLREQEAKGLVEALGAEGKLLGEPGAVMETMTTFAAARYVMAVKDLEGKAGDEGLSLEQLRRFCGDIAVLRRGELQAQRLELAWERLRLRGLISREVGGI